MKIRQNCRARARLSFEAMLLLTGSEVTITYQVLRSLRRGLAILTHPQPWHILECQSIDKDDWQALQFHAQKIGAQLWLQVPRQLRHGGMPCAS